MPSEAARQAVAGRKQDDFPLLPARHAGTCRAVRQPLEAATLPREGPLRQAGLGTERFSYVPRGGHVGQQIFQHGVEAIITHCFSIATRIQ